MAPLHQNQLAWMPCSRASPATNSGVSAEKVVATMEVPATHQGSERPARKKSPVPRLARRENATPMPSAITT